MRRKIAPSSLPARPTARALTPAGTRGGLPTAAALAFALLGAGCSAPLQDTIGADPVRATPESPEPAASAVPSAVPSIMPAPQVIKGGLGVVKPPAKHAKGA